MNIRQPPLRKLVGAIRKLFYGDRLCPVVLAGPARSP